ncbi:MFS transporter [Zavarzinia sp. CC-PAN008]|uniref:MFS transporter n=1 Tax=Zavarzinia sp. CC-PAN008 TaxID=3243332 RepID=UPI003F7463F1
MPAVLAVGSILLGIGLVSVGTGLLSTFLSVRLDMDQVGDGAIALILTGYPLGFLLGCLRGRVIIQSVGHIRAFAAFGGFMCAATLAFVIWDSPWFWFALRIGNGLCAAGLFTIAESWLQARTPAASRGLVIGCYMISDKLAYSAGQMLMTSADPHGPVLFALAAMAYALCLVPVSLTRAESPSIAGSVRLNFLQLYRISPVGIVGTFVAGVINTAVLSLSPIMLGNRGLDTAQIATVMTALTLGGLVLQWPIGWLSDHFDRRRVLLGITIATALVALLVAAIPTGNVVVLAVLAVAYGGIAFAIYPVAIAHAIDFAENRQVVEVSSGLLLSWAAGSVAGPAIASFAMERVGTAGLYGYAALTTALFAAFIIWRMTRRAPLPNDLQGRFVPMPQTTPTSGALNPRGSDAG